MLRIRPRSFVRRFVRHASTRESTPLVEELTQHIKAGGPMSMARYMQTCLTHPEHGYYTSQQASPFGSKGDFITSPEISQMFGELIGVWSMHVWQLMAQPHSVPVNVVEMGPGRGTLMRDLLRAARNFPDFLSHLSIHFVEVSPTLRREQQQALSVPSVKPVARKATPSPLQSPLSQVSSPQTDKHSAPNSKHSNAEPDPAAANAKLKNSMGKLLGMEHELLEDLDMTSEDGVCVESGKSDMGPTVTWHSSLDTVPKDDKCIIVAQELFDALPVHQFEYTASGWCEWMVALNDNSDEGEFFKLQLTDSPTAVSRALLHSSSVLLPNSTLRKAGQHKSTRQNVQEGEFKPVVGDRVEISPEAVMLAEDIGRRVARGGAALIIDYGADHVGRDTVQGIREHHFAPILSAPGAVDLSAHVDFSMLRKALLHGGGSGGDGGGVRVPPLVTQGYFLGGLGIQVRLQQLMQSVSNEEQREELLSQAKRLVEGDQMGTLFKVLCCTESSLATPAGFWLNEEDAQK